MVVPPRILTDADVAPFISDFTPAQNRALFASNALFAANKAARGALLTLFQRVCCTRAGQRDAYKAFVGFLESPAADIGALVDLLLDILASHPCPKP